MPTLTVHPVRSWRGRPAAGGSSGCPTPGGRAPAPSARTRSPSRPPGTAPAGRCCTAPAGPGSGETTAKHQFTSEEGSPPVGKKPHKLIEDFDNNGLAWTAPTSQRPVRPTRLTSSLGWERSGERWMRARERRPARTASPESETEREEAARSGNWAADSSLLHWRSVIPPQLYCCGPCDGQLIRKLPAAAGSLSTLRLSLTAAWPFLPFPSPG